MASGKAANQTTLSTEEIQGFRLFVGKAKCAMCHHGSSLTDGEFHNIRLRDAADDDRARALATVQRSEFSLSSKYNDAPSVIDHTRWAASSYALVNGYRTPSLRSVRMTQPYMHDGRFGSLEEVVEYYSEFSGAAEPGHHEGGVLLPLKLTPQEKRDLVAFLESL
jgi:cytochrome c peroxidase